MKNILVIEDNAGVAELICDKLNENGYDTHIAFSGKQALEFLQKYSIDMVILDYSLPDMDGKEIIASALGANIKMPPFIVSTGRGDEQLAVDMMKLGAYDYLIKDKSLINRLHEVVAKLRHEIIRDKELLQAQQALRESEERFRNFVERASDFFVKLSPDGYISYASPNWIQHMGFSPGELSGMTIYDLIYSDDAARLSEQIADAIQEENRHFTNEYRIWHKSKALKYHEVKGYSVVEKEMVFVNCIARDITEEKMGGKRLARAVFKAEEKEKRKFAEVLHEGIGPLVSAIKMSMGRIKTMKDFDAKELKVIDYCDKLVDDAVSQVRDLANDLMPSIINDFGLIAAIKSHIKKTSDNTDLDIRFDVKGDIPEPDKTTSIILYRAITKLVSVSLNSTNASHVAIKLEVDQDNILVFYNDNGKKILEGNIPGYKDVYVSLETMKNRLGSLNGSVAFDDKNPQGNNTKIIVPVVLPEQ